MTRATKRCLNEARPEELSERDKAEIGAFTQFLRLVGQATRAGVARVDAEQAIYPDVYGDQGTGGVDSAPDGADGSGGG